MIDPFPIGFWCDIPWDAEPPAIWWTPIESCRWRVAIGTGWHVQPVVFKRRYRPRRARAPPVDAQ